MVNIKENIQNQKTIIENFKPDTYFLYLSIVFVFDSCISV